MQIAGDEIIRLAFDRARQHQVVGRIVGDDVFDVLDHNQPAPFRWRTIKPAIFSSSKWYLRWICLRCKTPRASSRMSSDNTSSNARVHERICAGLPCGLMRALTSTFVSKTALITCVSFFAFCTAAVILPQTFWRVPRVLRQSLGQCRGQLLPLDNQAS